MSSAPVPPALSSAVVALRLYLEEAAAAVDATFRQAAASASIGRHGNTAAGFYTPSGALLLGGRESHPLLLEAAAEALACLVHRHDEGARPFTTGDLYLTNDPGCAAAGIEDLVLATPVVHDGTLEGFVALTAGHPGLGRATLAPVDRLRREGLVLPWMRAGQAGRAHAETVTLLAANSDNPEEFRDDLAVQIHALGQGRDALDEALARFGRECLGELAHVAAAGTRRAMQQVAGKLKTPEIIGRAAPFVARIFRETPHRVRIEAVNGERDHGVTTSLARAAVRAALREVLAVESPTLSGLGGLTDAVVIECVLGTTPPSHPAGEARLVGAQSVADAVRAAVAGALPHLTHAPDAACFLADVRGRRTDGSGYRARLGLPGGLGASVLGDGLTHGASTFSPYRTHGVEDIERALPVRVLRLQIVPDSAGPGQYHGGSGVLLELQLLEGWAEVDLLVPGRAIGMQGGMRGADARALHVTLRDGTKEIRGPARATVRLQPGDRLVLQSPGGGGWGIPFQRSIMRLEDDLIRGIVGPDHSRNRYGLVLKRGTLEKDDHLTYRVRHYLLSTLTVEDIIAGEELLD